jgi:hypothetical protein
LRALWRAASQANYIIAQRGAKGGRWQRVTMVIPATGRRRGFANVHKDECCGCRGIAPRKSYTIALHESLYCLMYYNVCDRVAVGETHDRCCRLTS